MTEQQLNELLSAVKGYLNITWDDQSTNDNLKRYLKSGEAYLNYKVFGGNSKQIDFTNDEIAKQLLFDYVRYANNYSLELFEQNFGNEVFNLQLREGVKDFARDDEEAPS